MADAIKARIASANRVLLAGRSGGEDERITAKASLVHKGSIIEMIKPMKTILQDSDKAAMTDLLMEVPWSGQDGGAICVTFSLARSKLKLQKNVSLEARCKTSENFFGTSLRSNGACCKTKRFPARTKKS